MFKGLILITDCPKLYCYSFSVESNITALVLYPVSAKKAFVPQTTILVSSLTAKTKHRDYQSGAITLCLNHRITELFGLEGTFKDHLVHPPAVGRDIFHYMMLFKVLSNLTLNTALNTAFNFRSLFRAPFNNFSLNATKMFLFSFLVRAHLHF